jgi:hypothetical protein
MHPLIEAERAEIQGLCRRLGVWDHAPAGLLV